MSRSILPNSRFLGLSSQNAGRDWDELIPRIDEIMDELGLSLAEETVVLIFPHIVELKQGENFNCRVCRLVTGPKKQPPDPFFMEDWNQRLVHRFSIKSEAWDEVINDCSLIWDELSHEGKKLQHGMVLFLKRRLVQGLELSIEAVFYE